MERHATIAVSFRLAARQLRVFRVRACVTREQVFEIADAREDLSALTVHVETDGALHVEWNDGHRSAWSPGWLRAHAYDASRAERQPHGRHVWAGDDATAIGVFAWRDVMEDDGALLAWLAALQRTG